MKSKILFLTALVLMACNSSETPEISSESSANPQSSESISISQQESSEEVSSQESESSLAPVTSESVSSELPVPGQDAWTLTGEALPKNPAQGKNRNIDFSVLNGKGETVSFHADYILRGGGSKNGVSIDNTIQLSKPDGNDKGYLYMTSSHAAFIRIVTLRNYVAYDGVDRSGVPSVYTADEMTDTNGEEVTLSRETSEDEHYYIYSAMLTHARFRLENTSSNALYIYSISYPA